MKRISLVRTTQALGVATALVLTGAVLTPAAHASEPDPGPSSSSIVPSTASTGVRTQRVGPACLTFHYTFDAGPTDPQIGETVTYTMQLANNSEVDSSRSTIVFRVDGLLDDSTWAPASLRASTGEVTVAGDTIAWTGPLDAGEDVVQRFTGVWDGAGDGLAFPRVESYGYVR